MKKIKLVFLFVILSLTLCQAQDSFEKNLQQHVQALTDSRMNGRAAGTSGEKRAAEYISRAFVRAGLELLYPKGYQDFSFVDSATGDTLYSQNVVAVIPGYDKNLREEYIVIGAHYDHLGTYTMKVNGRDSVCVYAGADGNASGVASLLELAAAAQAKHFMFKRSLLFVAFGAEERGSMGSWYFVNRAFTGSPIKMMINLDRMGRSSLDNYPMAFTGVSHYDLEQLLAQVGKQPYMPSVLAMGTDYFVSSHQAFLEQRIPVCLFTTGMHPQDHTLRDTPDLLDYDQMDLFCQYINAFIDQAANASDALFAFDSVPEAVEGQEPVYAYSDVDKAPMFMNADLQRFSSDWIYKYLKYPDQAVREGIKGRVMVSFIIETSGEVSQVEVARSVDPLLDAEAVRVISASPKWKAGEKNGQKVRVKIVLPVYFELRAN